MTDDAANTVLERKAQAQRRALGVGSVSLPRALGRALSIAADALWGLGLVATQSSDETLRTERAISKLGDDRLLIVLENDGGHCGLVALDRDVVTGLIEVQTLGKVTRFPTDTRAYTPTDAAMTAPLIDAALPRFASMLAGQPEMAHLQGYAFGALVEDAQTAALALDGAQYHVTSFDISLSQDTRTGRVVFLFADPPKSTDQARTTKTGKHETVLKLAPARMQAVLTRIHIPLHKAQALKPGDCLPISIQAVSTASLVVAGGHVAARGKLGQMNGLRAIRIGTETTPFHKPGNEQPPDPHQPSAPGRTAQKADMRNESAAVDAATFGETFDMALDELAANLPAPIDVPEP